MPILQYGFSRYSNYKKDSIQNVANVTLKEAFAGKFFFGTAINTRQLIGKEPEAVEAVKQHFLTFLKA